MRLFVLSDAVIDTMNHIQFEGQCTQSQVKKQVQFYFSEMIEFSEAEVPSGRGMGFLELGAGCLIGREWVQRPDRSDHACAAGKQYHELRSPPSGWETQDRRVYQE